MNAKVIKGLKLKARRYAQAKDLNKAYEKRAYQVLKKMYQEASSEERKKMGL